MSAGRDSPPGRAVERAFDIALAISTASWAILGLTEVPDRPIAVRIALAVINGSVAILIATRRAPERHGSVAMIFAALPSMILGGAAVRLADGPWSWPAQAVFVVGAVLATCSLLALGRSFAFLPSVRGLVGHGPYALVRHPAYASELLIMIACALARPWPNALLLVVTAVALHARIRAEESLLSADPAYETYRTRVRFRMLPGVY